MAPAFRESPDLRTPKTPFSSIQAPNPSKKIDQTPIKNPKTQIPPPNSHSDIDAYGRPPYARNRERPASRESSREIASARVHRRMRECSTNDITCIARIVSACRETHRCARVCFARVRECEGVKGCGFLFWCFVVVWFFGEVFLFFDGNVKFSVFSSFYGFDWIRDFCMCYKLIRNL